MSDIHVPFDDEYELSLEQIQMEHQMMFKSVDEIKQKLVDFDGRLTNLEKQQQQKHEPLPSSPKNFSKNTSNVVLKKAVKTEKERSTCFSYSFEKRGCLFYFEDLYDFDNKEININIGADSNRLTCPCGHLIRIHEHSPTAPKGELPPFANPPLGQWLYEELVPPVIQDWIWSYKMNKSNQDHQSAKAKKDD